MNDTVADQNEQKSGPRLPAGLLLGLNVIGALSLGLIISCTISAMRTAEELRHQKWLGRPLGYFFHHWIYPPADFIRWIWTYDHFGGRIPQILVSEEHRGLGIIIGVLIVWFLVASFVRSRLKATRIPDSSARFATNREIGKSGLIGHEPGIILGRTLVRGKLLRIPESEDRHVFLVAPTRVGKGRGLIIPTLMQWPHSVVVLDIKGENWYKTSGFRAKMGSRVLRMDFTTPHNNAPWRATWNPFDDINPEDLFRDASRIALDILDPDGKISFGGGNQAHWIQTGLSFLQSVITYLYETQGVGLDKKDPLTMRAITRTLSDPDNPFEALLEKMLAYPRGDVREAARDMLNKIPAERTGVLSTVNSFVSLYRDENVIRNTTHSNFSFLDMVDPKKPPTSLYITIPPSDLVRLRPLIRLFFNTFNDRLIKSDVEALETQKRRPVLFLLDELPALGHLKVLVDGIAHNAQYGIRYFLVAQNYSQMRDNYGDDGARTLLANCHTKVFMGTSDVPTGEMLTKMLGKTVKYSKRFNYSGDRFSLFLSHAMSSIQETERDLLTPSQIARMNDEMLIFRDTFRPILAKKIKYDEDNDFRRNVFPPVGANPVRPKKTPPTPPPPPPDAPPKGGERAPGFGDARETKEEKPRQPKPSAKKTGEEKPAKPKQKRSSEQPVIVPQDVSVAVSDRTTKPEDSSKKESTGNSPESTQEKPLAPFSLFRKKTETSGKTDPEKKERSA